MARKEKNYIQEKDGTFSHIPSSRPSNQNNPTTLGKIANYLEALSIKDPSIILTPLQKKFIRLVRTAEKTGSKVKLLKNGIDICHNIAIGAFIEGLIQQMNSPLPEDSDINDEFVDDALSSDDEEGKEEIKTYLADLQDPDIAAEKKIKLTKKVCDRFNRSSRNLIPGYSSPNRSIGDNRDPHLVDDAVTGEKKPILRSEKIAESAGAFLREEYKPKERINSEGEKEYQSSSVDADLEKSWCNARLFILPDDPLSPELVEEKKPKP